MQLKGNVFGGAANGLDRSVTAAAFSQKDSGPATQQCLLFKCRCSVNSPDGNSKCSSRPTRRAVSGMRLKDFQISNVEPVKLVNVNELANVVALVGPVA